MINNVIDINIDYEGMGIKKSPRQTTLTTYILDNENIATSTERIRPAVIVCPGGGYEFTSPREAEPIALHYCAAGFHSFVLNYSVAPSGFPAAICELSKAIAYVKSIAEENNIDKNRIFVIGFSAGGHLTASLGVHYNHPDVLKYAEIEKGENAPNGLLLCYPVITAECGKTHQGTIDNFSAGRDDIREIACLEKYVTPDTPPCFIWHTRTDQVVPVTSSLRFATALEANNIDFELHIYPEGEHGLSTGDAVTATTKERIVPSMQNWMNMSIRWINDMK